jgi:hypothetical protein
MKFTVILVGDKLMTALMGITIGALLLAAPASAQTPTPTPTYCALPTPTATPSAAATGTPTATPAAAATGTPAAAATATPTATPLAKTPQVRTIAVFLIDTDDGTPIIDREQVKDSVWTNEMSEVCVADVGSVRAVFDLASYGILEFEWDADEDGEYDIFGPYWSEHLAGPYGEGTCPFWDWSADALAAVVAAEIAVPGTGLTQDEIDAYDHLMFVLPWIDSESGPLWNNCFRALGQVNGRYTWVNWPGPDAGSMWHEIGHNMAFHVHVADTTDLNGSGAYGLNAPNLIYMDFMPTSSVVEIENEGVQEFTLLPVAVDPYENQGLRVVKIVVPSGNPYYISFRDDSGMDICIRDTIDRCIEPGVPWDCCTGSKAGTCRSAEFTASIHRSNLLWSGLEVIGWLQADDIFVDEGGNFKIEVTDISQGAEHLEMTMEVTFFPSGVLAYQEPI